MVISNAYYEVSGKVYYVDQFESEADGKEIAYIQEAVPQEYEGKYVSYNQNTYRRLDEWKTVGMDFFNDAVFLNGRCESCIYFRKIPFPAPKTIALFDEKFKYNTYRGYCKLRNWLNYENMMGNHYEAELYCNCEFQKTTSVCLNLLEGAQFIPVIRKAIFDIFKYLDHQCIIPKKPIGYLRNACLNPNQFEYLKDIAQDDCQLLIGDTGQFEDLCNTTIAPYKIMIGNESLKQCTVDKYYHYVVNEFHSILAGDGSFFAGKTIEDGFFICGESKIVEAVKQLDF